MKVWQKTMMLMVSPLLFVGCINKCDLWKEYTERDNRDVSLSGIVTHIYDSKARKCLHCVIEMEDGTQYQPHFQGLLEVLEVGDTLIKDSGSYKHIVIHASNHIVDTCYPCCDGQRLFKKNH